MFLSIDEAHILLLLVQLILQSVSFGLIQKNNKPNISPPNQHYLLFHSDSQN